MIRWPAFLLAAYLLVVFQGTIGRLLVFNVPQVGPIGPDVVAMLAVFVAMFARNTTDVMLAAWVLGLGLDLTNSGGSGATVVGPMPIAYVLTAGVLHRVREAFFRELWLAQAILAFLFCLASHIVWLALQTLFRSLPDWSAFGWITLEIAISAVYTAILMPFVFAVLRKCRSWLLSASAGASMTF
ncbi:MAG: hypothetical protein HZA50_07065 [Planctomycetes bacterium]|nr:hypothetical protein [Planctomycetota bacterium]